LCDIIMLTFESYQTVRLMLKLSLPCVYRMLIISYSINKVMLFKINTYMARMSVVNLVIN